MTNSLLNFDELDCAVSTVGESPLSCIIIGATHAGKSTTIGTLQGRDILYITTSSESHGFRNAVKMNQEVVAGGGKASKFIHVNLGVVQSIDLKLQAPYAEGSEIGSQVDPSMQATKLWFILECFKAVVVDAVAVDSLSALYDVLTSSLECQRACLTDKGSYNSFKEYQIVGSMYSRLSTILDEYNTRGVMTICTCLAKLDNFVEKNGIITPTSFSPDLPSVNVARSLLARFETTILQYRSPNIKNNTPHFSFNIKGNKTSKVRGEETIANHMDIDLRCQFLKLGYGLNRLPADLHNLKAHVETFMRNEDKRIALAEAEGKKQTAKTK